MRVTPAPLERPRDEEFRPVLICLSGELRGQRKALVSREMVIGRSSSADWHIDDGITSRTHALIVYDNHDDPGAMPRCYVEDLGSRNGTELNGKPIEGKTRLVERDRLLVGSTVIGFFVRDSEELQNEMSLYHSATRDPLTGLENRRQMVANLKGMMAKTSLGQRTLAFLLLDLDLFKQVNDTHGHDVGDEALKHVASIIRQTVREVDKTARWGGEEFAVIMPNVTASTAVRVAENLRRTIQAQPLMTSQGSVELTISIGVTLLVDNDSIESFFQRADQLLYKAKELGRNRVEADGASSTPSPIPPESEAARGPEGSASSG
jgi:diguanylate cyclase (GGDEF)-like protein